MTTSSATKTAAETPSFQYLLRNPSAFLAFGFGSGLAPKAPGTFGTLVAVPFYLGLQYLPLLWYVALLVVTSLVGIFLCGRAAKKLNSHDHPGIVWDEMVGYWITMLAAPAGWPWMVVGFILFRAFDIVKPWPIIWFDKKMGGGLGIMIDDIIAGFFACGCLHLSAYLWAMGPALPLTGG